MTGYGHDLEILLITLRKTQIDIWKINVDYEQLWWEGLNKNHEA